MTKPVITTRAGKGSALTWTEGDTNLTNLRDATISVTDGTTTAALDLNDTLTLTAGSGISVAVNSSTKTATITNTQSAGATNLNGLSDVAITSAANGDILYHTGTEWVDQSFTALLGNQSLTANFVDVTTDNTTNATNYLTFVNGSTGTEEIRADTGLTYNPSTGTIFATTFSGALSGNATTATTATGATNINISTTTGNTSDTSLYPVLVGAASTGNQLPHIDSALTYNASTDTLTATAFSGAINGTVGATTPATGVFTGLTAKGTTSTAKLTLDTTNVSSTAWTTAGIGLKVQAATFTDTSSTAGTVAASHVHAIATPTMASTNAITVTDAATLYIQGVPTNGTNTTITNKYALLVGGKIRTTGDMSVDGSLNANTGGSFGTLTSNGTVSFQATGSAAQDVRFYDNDNSNYVGFKSPGTVTANKIWTLPSADGSSGQVLSTDGAGALSWATAGGGTNVIVLSTPSLTQPNTTSASFTNVWTIRSSGGISGVSVSGSNNNITLPAGTWLFESESITSVVATAATDFRLYNNTDSDVLGEITNANYVTVAGNTRYQHGKLACVYTIASGSKAIGFYNAGSAPASAYTWTQRSGSSFSGGSATTFGVVMRITKLS